MMLLVSMSNETFFQFRILVSQCAKPSRSCPVQKERTFFDSYSSVHVCVGVGGGGVHVDGTKIHGIEGALKAH